MIFSLLAISSLFCAAYAQVKGTSGNHVFDYIVVGGGTAGIPLGTRLAEAGYSVGIVEAGGWYLEEESILTLTPAFTFGNNAANDWGFNVVPQPGMAYREFGYPRGKCLGGSSARNAMTYQRASTGAFQKWADEVDDQSYALPQFEEYFKRSTAFTAPNSASRAKNGTPSYNKSAFSSGADGPLAVTYANWASPFSSWVQKAMGAVGIHDAGDFNSGNIMGSQYFQLTMLPEIQERASAANTYLNQHEKLSKLTVFTHALAKRILFDERKRTTGVVVHMADTDFTFQARNKVILSAGAFQSPQLLMVSGVGPRNSLREFDIPVVHHNPHIGQNLIDHMWFDVSYRVNVETWTKWANDPFQMLNQYVGPYRQRQRGPLTANTGDFAGFEKVPEDLRRHFTSDALEDLSEFPSDWPELEFIASPLHLGDFSDVMGGQPKDGSMYASIAAALVAPVSVGNVSLRSADTMDLPLANPNTLGSTTDQQVAVAGMKRIRQIFEAAEMKPAIIGEEYYPGPELTTDAEILAHIQRSGLAFYHAGGSCAMGNPEKRGNKAVVDQKARVIGVKNLRVVDASILPFLPPSHIQSAIYALAEKIADEIVTESTGCNGCEGPSQHTLNSNFGSESGCL